MKTATSNSCLIGWFFAACCATVLLLAAGPLPYPKEAAKSVIYQERPQRKQEPKIEISGAKELTDGLKELARQIKSIPTPPPVHVVQAEAPPPPPVPDKPVTTTKLFVPAPRPTAPEDDPSTPNIVVEAPETGKVAEIIVVSAAKSTNVKRLKWSIFPAVPFYTPDNVKPREIVFAVAEEGLYRVTVRATSPDGGFDERTETIKVGVDDEGSPAGPVSSAGDSRRRVAIMPSSNLTDYNKFVRSIAHTIGGTNKKGDAAAMASSFYAAWGLMNSGGIRNAVELFNYTDKDIEKLLGNDLDNCKDFLTALLQQTAAERPRGMDRMKEVWQQIADTLKAISR